MIGDGEQTKTGFFAYIGERLSGFEPRADRSPLDAFRPEVDSFPEYYEQYFQTAMTGGMAAPVVPLGCTGPVSYTGHERLRRDLDLLRAAAGEAGPDEVFVCAVAPSGVGGTGSAQDKLAIAGLYANAINRSLRGIPRERVRVHTCYGINEGPRVHDASLADLADVLFTIEAGGFSFEAANPRHEHVYHVFETVKLPPDTVLLPGSSATPRTSSSTRRSSPTGSSGSPSSWAGKTS